jgi:small subunit ribosomal protein S3
MGHKVRPEILRVGYIHDWKSTWFNEKEFSDYLIEDVHIRDHITNKLAHAGLSDITIRKDTNEVEVNINTARPGIVIGKSGSEVDALRRELHKMTGKSVKVNILEIKRPELDSKLVAQSVGEQLQNRVAFRRAMKRALTSAMRSGAKGVKIQVSGRLGGAEMARTEGYSDGRVPLHTLRADIDFGFYEARTTFGRIGVKVWINKGEIMPSGFAQDLTEIEAPQQARVGSGGPGGRGPGGRGGPGGGRGPGGPGGGRGPGGPGGPGGRGGGPGGRGGGPGGRGGGPGGRGGGGGRGPGGPGGRGGGGGGGRGPGGGGGGGGGRGGDGPSRGGSGAQSGPTPQGGEAGGSGGTMAPQKGDNS